MNAVLRSRVLLDTLKPTSTMASVRLLQSVLFSTSPPTRSASQKSTSSSSSNIFNVQDDEDFKKRVLGNEKPVVVDFHATWCGPCKILGPRLEKHMSAYAGTADFAKVDIDQLADLAFDYKVSSVPTVVAFRAGKEVAKFVGLIDDDKIKQFLKSVIEK